MGMSSKHVHYVLIYAQHSTNRKFMRNRRYEAFADQMDVQFVAKRKKTSRSKRQRERGWYVGEMIDRP